MAPVFFVINALVLLVTYIDLVVYVFSAPVLFCIKRTIRKNILKPLVAHIFPVVMKFHYNPAKPSATIKNVLADVFLKFFVNL